MRTEEEYNESERFFIPAIGNISSGKSSFLNAVLGLPHLDILESKNKATTKCVFIIRHKKGQQDPRFFKMKVYGTQKENENEIDYIFEKEDTEFNKEKVKSEIEKMNAKMTENIEQQTAKADKKIEVEFIDSFFLIEIDLSHIGTDEFFAKYDILDTPGLNEGKVDYVASIYKYIKKKVKFGILIFDSQSHKDRDALLLFDKVKDLCGITFSNFLIILNRIDKSSDPEAVFKEFRTHLMNHGENGEDSFQESNYFLQVDSIKLKNEVLMSKDPSKFEYFIHFLYKDYIKESKNFSRNQNNKLTNANFNFLDHIKNLLCNNKSLGPAKIKELATKIDSNKLTELKMVIVGLNKIKDENYHFGFDADQLFIEEGQNPDEGEGRGEEEPDEPNGPEPGEDNDMEEKEWLVALYNAYKQGLIKIEPSDELQKIKKFFSTEKKFDEKDVQEEETDLKNGIDYDDENFSLGDMDTLEVLIKKHEENNESLSKYSKLQQLVIKFNIFMTKIFYKIKKEEPFIQDLCLDTNSLTKIMLEDKIRIPIVGCYSSGKSSFINGLIGDDILPTADTECTRKAIIIRNIPNKDRISIRKCKIKNVEIKKRHFYYLKENKNVLNTNEKDIRENILNGFNDKGFSRGDPFYMLEKHIDFLDNVDIDDELKYKIEFVDLPGLNTDGNTFAGSIMNDEEEKEEEENESDNRTYITTFKQKEKNLSRKESEDDVDPLLKLLGICNLFIFIIAFDTGVETENNRKIMRSLIKTMKLNSLKINETDDEFMNYSMFVINKCDQDKNNEYNEDTIRKTIADLINISNNISKINVQKYSAKKYLEFKKLHRLFYNTNDFYKEADEDYQRAYYPHIPLIHNFYKHTIDRFLVPTINLSIPSFSNLKLSSNTKQKAPAFKHKDKTISDEFVKISQYSEKYKEYYGNLVSIGINYYRKNENDSVLLAKSNFNNFQKLYVKLIKKAYKTNQVNYLTKLDDIISKVKRFLKEGADSFIQRSLEKDILEKQKEGINLNKKAEKIFSDYSVKNEFNKFNREMDSYFDNYINHPKEGLKSLGGDLEKAINQISSQIDNKMGDFEKRLKNLSNNLSNELKEHSNKFCNFIQELDSNLNLKIGKQEIEGSSALKGFFASLGIGVGGGAAVVGALGFIGGAAGLAGLLPCFAAGGIIGLGIGLAGGVLYAIGSSIFGYFQKEKKFVQCVKEIKNKFKSQISSCQHVVVDSFDTLRADYLSKCNDALEQRLTTLQEEHKDKYDFAAKQFVLIDEEYQQLLQEK